MTFLVFRSFTGSFLYPDPLLGLCLYATGKTTGINIVVGDATKNEPTEIAFVHDQFQIGKTLLLKTVDAVELEANLLQIFDLWKANSWHDGARHRRWDDRLRGS